MTKLAIEQIDVDDTKLAEFVAGKNAEVRVYFNRAFTVGEKKRAREVANSVLLDGQAASAGSDFVRFYVRDGGPVERFLEIARAGCSKWDDEAAQELKQAEADLHSLESSLRDFIKQ